MSDSTRKRRRRKDADRPKKPYPDFPLTPHPSGAWQKKIRGKIHYFGRWAKRVNGKLVRIDGDGWKEALQEYKKVADDLHACRTPRVQSDGLTVADLCNRFLTAKLRQREAGEIGPRMFGEYKAATDRLVAMFGKARLVDDLAADDFEALRDALAKQYGPARLGTEIQIVRTVFKYAFESGLIDRPVRYGPQFRKPSTSVLRRHRAKQGPKLFVADEIRRLLDAASAPMRAMILLGINCGFGNSDCGNLPVSAVDLDAGMVDFPRPKTGIARRCPLWPETVAALRDSLEKRTEPKKEDDAALVFVTKYGESWAKDVADSPITKEMRKLLNKLGIDGHRNFYALRHTFRTIADESKDQPAIDLIMGHTDPSMAGRYRERIDDNRLLAVAEHVRQWLFGEEPDGGDEGDGATPDDPPVGESGGTLDKRSPENCVGSVGSVGADEDTVRRVASGQAYLRRERGHGYI
jgi:integrase